MGGVEGADEGAQPVAEALWVGVFARVDVGERDLEEGEEGGGCGGG